MKSKMKRPTHMLLALLKRSLSNDRETLKPFEEAGEADWQACYRQACQQGVMAISWDGLVSLPPSLQPPRQLKLSWALMVGRYEERYARYCHTVHTLSELLRLHGIGLMQLKGVGLSTCYPIPSHREGGDIDIRIYPLNPATMTQDEAIAKAESLMEEQGIEVDRAHSKKHNTFRYQGIMIENHKTFLNVSSNRQARPLETYLHRHASPVEVGLLEGQYPINVPSDEFNAVFVGFHAAQHYGNGLSLHHLCDWACLLQRGVWELLPTYLMTPKVKSFYQALTALSHHYIGTVTETEYDESLAEDILHEIISPRFPATVTANDLGNKPLRIFAYKWRRIRYSNHLHSQVFESRLFCRLWTALKNNYWRPARLFRVTWKK